jgi:ATP-binding cassette subfamily A (ABC1) protein 3
MYGMDLDKELIEIRKNVGLCTQRDTLYPYLTVMEHLTFMAGIKGIVSTRFDHILAITELGNDCDKLVNQLSGGSMRKLSLALSLLGDAKIIFLDEPTSGMDAYSRRSIWKILERIKLEKRTIILTTHHLDEAEILADRIGIMARG